MGPEVNTIRNSYRFLVACGQDRVVKTDHDFFTSGASIDLEEAALQHLSDSSAIGAEK